MLKRRKTCRQEASSRGRLPTKERRLVVSIKRPQSELQRKRIIPNGLCIHNMCRAIYSIWPQKEHKLEHLNQVFATAATSQDWRIIRCSKYSTAFFFFKTQSSVMLFRRQLAEGIVTLSRNICPRVHRLRMQGQAPKQTNPQNTQHRKGILQL